VTKVVGVFLRFRAHFIYDMSETQFFIQPYSYTTSNDASEQEIEMVLNLCFNYSKKDYD
jgi:hypothetical protein